MTLALALFFLSIAASVILGTIGGPYVTHVGSGFQFNFFMGDSNPVKSTLGLLMPLHVLLGTGVGIWALAQGIVAAASNRGRRFGVIAIIFAALAPGFSLVAFFVSLGISAS